MIITLCNIERDSIMELAKIQENGFVKVVFCAPDDGSKMTQLRESGFLDFVPSEQPQEETGQIAVDSYKIVNGKVVQSWEIKTDPEAIQTQINGLKEQLSESDYKVTKCYECSLIGETLPYDIQALHTERQAIRDEINRLEALLPQSYS